MQDTQAKDDALAALDGTDFNQMFGFELIPDDNFDPYNDPSACVGCAE